jgi:hypothetical protein
MPERLNRITIALNTTDVVLTWDERDRLMARLQHARSRARIRDSIQAVGATRPVELKAGQRAALLNVLEEWSRDGGGDGAMPEGLHHLHTALIEDLNAAG